MYTIYVDNQILFHPLLISKGCAVTSATVDVELDKTGSATITIPVTNPLYNSIYKMKSMVQIMQDGEEIFRGRVLHDERDFEGNKELYCEGELAFMIDNVFPPYRFNNYTVAQAFNTFVSVYNTQVEPTKRFTVGNVTVTGTVNVTNYDFTILLDELNAQLVDKFGGHIRTRLTNGVRYIDYLADYSHVCDQTIEFGENLLDFSEYISAEDLFTVLIPLGARREDANGNYIGRVNIAGIQTGHHEYVSDRAAEEIFGNIWKIQIWEDVTDPYELRALGEAYLSKNISAAVTMNVKAIDLSIIDVDAEAIHIGDGIRVVSIPHGVDDIFQCSRISYDLLNPENSEYEFGKPKKSICEDQAETSQTASSAATKSEASADNALVAAKAYTDSEILKVTNNYESDRSVIIDENNLNYAYTRLIDRISPKQYRTGNGEDRLKLGVVAEDLLNAMANEGFGDLPIVNANGLGHYSVSYDEIVALLWKKVQTIQNDMANINSKSLWSINSSYSRSKSNDITVNGAYTGISGVCYNTNTNRLVFAMVDNTGGGVLVESSLDLQTIHRVSSPMQLGYGNSLAYVPSTNRIYCAAGNRGSNANRMIEINASDFSIISAKVCYASSTPWQVAYESNNNRIYYYADNRLVTADTSFYTTSAIAVPSLRTVIPSVTSQGAFTYGGEFYVVWSDQTNERTYFSSYNLSTGAIKDILYISTESTFEAEDGFSIGDNIYIIGGQSQVYMKRIGLAGVVRRYFNG